MEVLVILVKSPHSREGQPMTKEYMEQAGMEIIATAIIRQANILIINIIILQVDIPNGVITSKLFNY